MAIDPEQKTILEEVEELTASIPDEEFLKLPADGAEQVDHYVYGLPKRSKEEQDREDVAKFGAAFGMICGLVKVM